MRILVAHNSYQQRGGEDAVVAAEVGQLESHGDTVVRYSRHNDELHGIGALGRLRAAAETVWAFRAKDELERVIADHKPDIAHFHNTFPLISPAAYYACANAGIPVVQTLHNFRLMCPAATLVRDGKICESCVGRAVPWAGMLHRCYHHSLAQTAALGAMLGAHSAARTWRTKVDLYIALTEFARRKFVEGGLPPERVVVKPNFVHPAPRPKEGVGEYALFVGRLAAEKGVELLLHAWRELKPAAIPLRIAGDGPLREKLESEIKKSELTNVSLLGSVSPAQVADQMRGARFLLCPSLWYEGFPVTVAEAFACGLPVIASDLGSLAEIVAQGRTGLHVTPGDPRELACAVEWAWDHPEAMECMGRHARGEFERKYTAERNYRNLMRIYDRLLDRKSETQFGARSSFVVGAAALEQEFRREHAR